LSFEHSLEPGDVIDNAQLTDIFKCSPQGGIARYRLSVLQSLVDEWVNLSKQGWVNLPEHHSFSKDQYPCPCFRPHDINLRRSVDR
jgi:5-methylcytosine-specific restriction enzyme A